MKYTTLALLVVLSITNLIHGEVPDTIPEVPIPAFEQLVVKIEPFGLGHPEQTEELRIEATGRCWYRFDGRDAQRKSPPDRRRYLITIWQQSMSADSIGYWEKPIG